MAPLGSSNEVLLVERLLILATPRLESKPNNGVVIPGLQCSIGEGLEGMSKHFEDLVHPLGRNFTPAFLSCRGLPLINALLQGRRHIALGFVSGSIRHLSSFIVGSSGSTGLEKSGSKEAPSFNSSSLFLLLLCLGKVLLLALQTFQELLVEG